MNKVIQGDCLEKLKELEDNSVDAVVTDPPYGLSFMGKKWDYDVPSVEIWAECLRVLKPGGYLLAFAGTRTQHRMAVRIEDAGFEIRDMIFWNYASGFPKSLNIWKQLKKKCKCGIMEEYEKSRNERGVSLQQEAEHDMRFMWERNLSQSINSENEQGEVLQSGLSEQNSQVQQPKSTENVWGEQPSVERGNNNEKTEGELQGSEVCEMPEGVSTNGEEGRVHNGTQVGDGSTHRENVDQNGSSTPRRPQSEQQSDREPCAFCKQHFAQAIRTYGFGTAIKPACEPITLARKPISEKNVAENCLKWGVGGINIDGCRVEYKSKDDMEIRKNLIRDSSNSSTFKNINRYSQLVESGRFPSNLLHDGSDEVVSLFPNSKGAIAPVKNKVLPTTSNTDNYKKHSMVGDDGLSFRNDSGSASRFFYCAKSSRSERTNKGTITNGHPTIKPIALMEYLVKLVSREGAVVLDPFSGSGSTLLACKNLDRQYIGIEREADYIEIINKRLQ